MKQFPVLTTPRLLLRQPEERDIDFIFSQRSSPVVNKFIKRELAKTRQDAVNHFEKISRNFVENKGVAWSICLRENNEMIGGISLWNFSEDLKKAELGYDLDPMHHKKGYMHEAVRPVIHHGFMLGFEVIEAFTDRRNEPSKQLLLRNSFKHVPERTDEGNADNWIFTIHKKGEFLSSP